MASPAPTPDAFILAAKHCEIGILEALTETCDVVTTISQLVHELQRERALSNIHLVSHGERLVAQRQQQIERCRDHEVRLRHLLSRRYLSAPPGHTSMPLLNTIALVLQGMDGLPDLRNRISGLAMGPEDATFAFRRLIAGLLSVVFHAADVASEPAITRTLVALFNFMQGKEYAGQERAWGSIGFATGQFNREWGARIDQLQELQNRSFEDFHRFAGDAPRQQWHAHEADTCNRDLDRLRALIGRLCQGHSIDSEISEVWYEVATRRIDGLRTIETALTQSLQQTCREQLAKARHDLRFQQSRLSDLVHHQTPLTLLFDTRALPFTDHFQRRDIASPEQARSVYELMLGQAEQIKQMEDALEEARRALRERKQIEKAKGLLMRQLGLNEEQAYARMRENAMRNNQRLAELAAALIEAAETAGGKPRTKNE